MNADRRLSISVALLIIGRMIGAWWGAWSSPLLAAGGAVGGFIMAIVFLAPALLDEDVQLMMSGPVLMMAAAVGAYGGALLGPGSAALGAAVAPEIVAAWLMHQDDDA